MTGLLQDVDRLSVDQWRGGLTGNLCRCTGYSPIIEAGLVAQRNRIRRLEEMYPDKPMLEGYQTHRKDQILISDQERGLQVFCPVDLASALHTLSQHPDAKIVAGATDVGVQFNKGTCRPQVWIDLNRIDELEGIEVSGNTIDAA